MILYSSLVLLNTLTIGFFSLNLCLIYLLADISYNITDNFFIYLSILQYNNFLVIDFINRLKKNLSIFHFVIFNIVK